MNLLAALLTICIAIEIYHMAFYKWIVQGIHMMQTTSKEFDDRTKNQEDTPKSIEETNKDVDAYLKASDVFVTQYIGPMIVEVIYWCLFVFISIYIACGYNIPVAGIMLFVIIAGMSFVTSKLIKKWKAVGKEAACKVVAIVDSLISICIYAAYAIMYCF